MLVKHKNKDWCQCSKTPPGWCQWVQQKNSQVWCQFRQNTPKCWQWRKKQDCCQCNKLPLGLVLLPQESKCMVNGVLGLRVKEKQVCSWWRVWWVSVGPVVVMGAEGDRRCVYKCCNLGGRGDYWRLSGALGVPWWSSWAIKVHLWSLGAEEYCGGQFGAEGYHDGQWGS